MAFLLERLSTHTLRDRIAERLREAILDGSFQEGERLVERKIAAQLGASVTSVREALIELERDGFICKRPNSATHVITLSMGEAQKIFAVRRVLEGFAVEEAARLGSTERVLELEQLYLDLLQAARAKDTKEFVKRDYAFHEKIWEAADNECLQTALKRMILPLFAFCAMRIVSRRSLDLVRDAELHLSILAAIKAGDPQAAQKTFSLVLEQWISEAWSCVFEESDIR